MQVIKFGAVWCAGCLIMKPRWAEIEEKNPWLKTVFYDYDDNRDMVQKYGVNEVLPTCIFLNSKGEELTRIQGEVSKEHIEKLITEYKNA